MPINYGSDNGNYEKLPKVGEKPKEFKIVKCEKVQDKEYKYNFIKKEIVELANGTKAKVDVNQGYRFVFTLDNGKTLTLSSWKPFYAFKAANVQEGDHIRVHHPAEGEWQVEVLNRPNPADKYSEEPAWDEGPDEL